MGKPLHQHPLNFLDKRKKLEYICTPMYDDQETLRQVEDEIEQAAGKRRRLPTMDFFVITGTPYRATYKEIAYDILVPNGAVKEIHNNLGWMAEYPCVRARYGTRFVGCELTESV